MSLFARHTIYHHRRGRKAKRSGWLALGAVLLLCFSLLPWGILLAKDHAGISDLLSGQAKASLEAPVTPGRYGIAAGGGLAYYGARDLDARMEAMRLAGATWVRFDIDWSNIQAKGQSQYNWEPYDRVVAAASAHRLNVVALLSYTPPWARPRNCQTSAQCPPANPAQFAAFAKKAVARYAPEGVKTWEIWNEPNVHYFWLPATDPSAYAALLRATYPAIKQEQPSATVITGGLASAGDETGDLSPLTFVQQLYRAGAKGSFDALALHPYSYPALPSYPGSWNRWQQIAPIHSEMTLHGDGNKKIWITEYGVPTGGSGNAHSANQVEHYTYGRDYMTEQAQKDLIKDAFAGYRRYAAWTGPFLWYNFRDTSTDRSSPENFFGLLRTDGSPKPAYWEFKRQATGQ